MAKGNFAACLKVILRYEGGRANDPRDPGGRTNEGVTQRTYDAWRRRRRLGPLDVYRMPDNERDAIYRAGFWDKVGGDDLPAGVDLVVFDPAVNSGPGRALTWYRQANPDGARDPLAVIAAISARRLSFLHALGTWSHFGGGWGRRVAGIEAQAHAMALHPAPPGAIPARLSDIAAAHRAKAQDKAEVTAPTIVAATIGAGVLAGPAANAAPALTPLFVLLVVGGLVAAAVTAFVAWRLRQRAQAFAVQAATPRPPAAA